MNNTYLAHHGILGMKWGVRRSEAQLARASGHSSKSSDDKNEVSARKVAVKNRRTMSDGDLKKRIERLKLEREFKNLTEDDIAPGRKYVSEILSASGKKALTMAAAGAMTYAVKTAMTKAGVSLLAFEVYAFYIKSVARSFYSQLLLLWIPMRTKFPLCFLSAFFLMLFLIPFI